MSGYYSLTREFTRNPTRPSQIGRGLSLDKFTTRQGSLNFETGLPHVIQAMKVILSTKRGSRFFNPDFGSDIHTCLFEDNTFAKRQMIETYAREALERWEPRITDIQLDVSPRQELGKATLFIHFLLKGDNGQHSVRYELTPDGGVINGEVA